MTNSSGAVVNTYEYDAYGIPVASGTTGTQYNPFGFSGEYTDQESGLIYLRARYYDPSTQQFLTRDPLEGASEQAYAYAGGSPLNATDPSGMFLDTLFDIGFVLWDIDDILNGEGLNWGTAGALAFDVGAAVIPFLPSGAGAARRGTRTFFTVQDEADTARLFSDGTPWPTEWNRANLGEGLYAWGTRSDAKAYKALMEQHGVSGLRILKATIGEAEYRGLRTLDLRAYSDAAVDAWMNVYSRYGSGEPHSYQHIIRSAAMGDEFYFSKDVFHLFRVRR